MAPAGTRPLLCCSAPSARGAALSHPRARHPMPPGTGSIVGAQRDSLSVGAASVKGTNLDGPTIRQLIRSPPEGGT